MEPVCLPMQLTIRRAEARDAAGIARLCAELGYAAEAAEVKDRLGALVHLKTDFVAVAEGDNGLLIGWIQGHLSHALESGYRAEITGLVVSGSSRRSGVGKKLVAAVEEWARRERAPAIVVRSNVVRAESHAFYPALGYTETKQQRVYRKQLVF